MVKFHLCERPYPRSTTGDYKEGHTCSVVRRTKLLVRLCLLPLKMDHPGVILVMGDLDCPLDQHGQLS